MHKYDSGYVSAKDYLNSRVLNGEGNGTPLQYSFAWKIPWTKEPGRLQSMGFLRIRHDRANSLSPFTFMQWRRKWQPTPVFLPENSCPLRISGTGEPGGLPSMGSHRVRHNWSNLAAAAEFSKPSSASTPYSWQAWSVNLQDLWNPRSQSSPTFECWLRL